MSISLSSEAAARWPRLLLVPLTILAWLAVLLVVSWLLGHVIRTLVMIVLAVILAFALAPLVVLLTRWLRRPYAIAGAYALGVAVVLGLGTLLVATAAAQVVNLVAALPTYVQQVQQVEPQLLVLLGPFGVTPATFLSLNQQFLTALQQVGEALAAGSVGVLRDILGVILDAVLTLMLSVYFIANGPRIGAWLANDTPPALRQWARLFVGIVTQVVGGYVRGTVTMGLLLGVLVGAGLSILGVPYGVLLGVLAFFMAFIPVIGTLISGAVSVMVALPSGFPRALLVLAYFVVVHVIEDDVVGPRVVGKAVGIHPATSLVALLAGTELFGVWGALFAAPIAGLLQAIAIAAWREVVSPTSKMVLPVARRDATTEVSSGDG
jgi:predicted PurR-regulated permease PerM